MKNVLKLLKAYELKKESSCMELILYSDCSGHINNDADENIFDFHTIEELITELKS